MFNLSLSHLHPVVAGPYVGLPASVFSALDQITPFDSGTNQSHLQYLVSRLVSRVEGKRALNTLQKLIMVLMSVHDQKSGPESFTKQSCLCIKVKEQTTNI